MTNCLRGKNIHSKKIKSWIIGRDEDVEEEKENHLICENKNYLLINTERSPPSFFFTASSRGKFMVSEAKYLEEKNYIYFDSRDISEIRSKRRWKIT